MRRQERFSRNDRVIWSPPNGDPDEIGVVTRLNERYVFVRFNGDSHSKACSSGMLKPAPLGGVGSEPT